MENKICECTNGFWILLRQRKKGAIMWEQYIYVRRIGFEKQINTYMFRKHIVTREKLKASVDHMTLKTNGESNFKLIRGNWIPLFFTYQITDPACSLHYRTDLYYWKQEGKLFALNFTFEIFTRIAIFRNLKPSICKRYYNKKTSYASQFFKFTRSSF